MSNILGKPEPHSDVINKEPKVLLIGMGWVGQFVNKYFTQAHAWTPSKGLLDENKKQILTPDEVIQEKLLHHKYDAAFISVPTPMKDDGSCDTSIVEKAVEIWHEHVDLFIIRSTVQVGTTDKLAATYPHDKFVMQPEYVGETLGHPLVEPARDPFIILGGTKDATQKAAECWSRVLHANCKIRQVSALTAELCKYMENCFLGTKVIFVNEFRQLAEKIGVDFLELREAWLDDPRIGRSHSMAYEDNPGFSGKCLPKDLNAIAKTAREAGSPLKIIEAILQINAEMRKACNNTVPLLPREK